MIEIADNAIVLQDGCSPVSSKPSDRTISPPLSLETLSISTSSMSYTESDSNTNIHNHNCKYTTTEDEDVNSELNDGSSSVSSLNSSNNIEGSSISITPKRSVFSNYWKKTGQKPTTLQPVKSLSASDSVSTLDNDARTSIATSHVLSSPLHFPLDRHLLQSMSSADFLEDDDAGNSSYHDDTSPEHASEQPPQAQHQDQQLQQQQGQPLQRRRSILPRAPASHPALKSTSTVMTQRRRSSWRKSASLSNVAEGYSCYGNNSPLACTTPKTRSLPGMRSSSSTSLLQPGPSCLRPYQKYSPSKADADAYSRRSLVLSSSTSWSASSSSSPSSPTMLPKMMSSGASVSSRDQLSRCGSSSTVSLVSFLEAVDVRHFEPPRETYAGKGWSDYFK